MNYYIPQWEERTSYGIRRIDPYAKLFEDRIIFLGTPISDDIANAVMAQLLCLESMDPARDIQIYINSPGGSFTAMTARNWNGRSPGRRRAEGSRAGCARKTAPGSRSSGPATPAPTRACAT